MRCVILPLTVRRIERGGDSDGEAEVGVDKATTAYTCKQPLHSLTHVPCGTHNLTDKHKGQTKHRSVDPTLYPPVAVFK
jgi:hypothetical protein